jgi:hypothetical protein
MDANTITAKLHETADKKLKEHIGLIVQPVYAIEQKHPTRIYVGLYMESSKVKLNIHTVLNEIQTALFDTLSPTWRNNEVNAFMAKIENMQTELDEIKEQVSQ